jgi:hypothetical protein
MSSELSAFSRSICFSMSALLMASLLGVDEIVRTESNELWLRGVSCDSGVPYSESCILQRFQSKLCVCVQPKVGDGSILSAKNMGNKQNRESATAWRNIPFMNKTTLHGFRHSTMNL